MSRLKLLANKAVIELKARGYEILTNNQYLVCDAYSWKPDWKIIRHGPCYVYCCYYFILFYFIPWNSFPENGNFRSLKFAHSKLTSVCKKGEAKDLNGKPEEDTHTHLETLKK